MTNLSVNKWIQSWKCIKVLVTSSQQVTKLKTDKGCPKSKGSKFPKVKCGKNELLRSQIGPKGQSEGGQWTGVCHKQAN